MICSVPIELVQFTVILLAKVVAIAVVELVIAVVILWGVIFDDKLITIYEDDDAEVDGKFTVLTRTKASGTERIGTEQNNDCTLHSLVISFQKVYLTFY